MWISGFTANVPITSQAQSSICSLQSTCPYRCYKPVRTLQVLLIHFPHLVRSSLKFVLPQNPPIHSRGHHFDSDPHFTLVLCHFHSPTFLSPFPVPLCLLYTVSPEIVSFSPEETLVLSWLDSSHDFLEQYSRQY